MKNKNAVDDGVLYEIVSGVGKTNKVRPMTIAVDFDRTLCVRHSGQSIFNLGEPIPLMVNRVKKWLAERKKVIIFTARHPKQHPLIRNWLEEHGLQNLEITNEKSANMDEFWDDKAKRVIENTGIEDDGGLCPYVKDLIHNDIYEAMNLGEFSRLNEICKSAISFPTSIQRIILTASRGARSKLPARETLFSNYKYRIRKEDDNVWSGLK